MLRIVFIVSIVLLSSSCMHARFNEENFLKLMPVAEFTLIAPDGYQLKKLKVVHSDNNSSYGVAITRPENANTIMYFGGNGFVIEKHGSQFINIFTQLNVNVIMFDHRGYGQSTGVPTVAFLKSDALDNYDYVKDNYQGRIILHGQSLGSFEAGAVADSRSIDALVLESSATNIDEWIAKAMPWYIKPFAEIEISTKLRLLDNKKVVRKYTNPLMILVGKDDKQTPYKLSELLYSVSSSKNKILHVLKNSTHNNVPRNSKFLEVYTDFISTLIPL